jgi:murein DD-endopeptidase MepM/ murein hydrolase activator NlpD
LKLIVIKDTQSKPRTFSFNSQQLKLIRAGVIAFPCFLLIAAVSIWYGLVSSSKPDNLVSYQGQVALLRQDAQQTLTAYAKRMGAFQAQMSRIEAVAERLAEQVGLDIEAFQFESDSGVGGASPDMVSINEGSLVAQLRKLELSISANAVQFEALGYLLSDNQQSQSREPAGWPVDDGWISSGYGSRTNPLTGKRQFHQGVDIPGHSGSQVVAVADGVVLQSKYAGSYGWTVELNHGDGLQTQYSHNKENLVEVGDTVHKGQVIALLGSTGRSTGPHVHFEVKQSGKTVNPYPYIKNKI